MENSYDYDLLWRQTKNSHSDIVHGDYYEKVFSGLDIDTIHDCTCGSGNLTFPLVYLGYTVTGSDISENMIRLANERAQQEGLSERFLVCDLREIEGHVPKDLGCLISSGNSLPHVTNDDVFEFFKAASLIVRDGGYLYFDLRNWDKILKDRQRFFVYDMRVLENGFKHVLQVWDYNPDGSLTYNLLFHDFDEDGRVTGKRYQYVPPYYPVLYDDIELHLRDAGFQIVSRRNYDPFGSLGDEETRRIDLISGEAEFMKVDWYSVLARKSE